MNQQLIDGLTEFASCGQGHYFLTLAECREVLALVGEFDRFCRALCPNCRGEYSDVNPQPVRVSDYARARGDLIPAYVHPVAGGHRVLCGASALRLMRDGERQAQHLQPANDLEKQARAAVS